MSLSLLSTKASEGEEGKNRVRRVSRSTELRQAPLTMTADGVGKEGLREGDGIGGVRAIEMSLCQRHVCQCLDKTEQLRFDTREFRGAVLHTQT